MTFFIKPHPDYEPVQSLHKQVQNLLNNLNAQAITSPLPAAGNVAPDIALPDPQGDTIRLSSTRGKIVLPISGLHGAILAARRILTW